MLLLVLWRVWSVELELLLVKDDDERNSNFHTIPFFTSSVVHHLVLGLERGLQAFFFGLASLERPLGVGQQH